MKFYKLERAGWGDEQKVYPSLDGISLREGKEFIGIEGSIKNFNTVDEAPLFDYFTMISISEEGPYDWILLDAYSFAGKSAVPMVRGWGISKRLKELLEEFSIGEPFRFYPAKVMFKGNKYDYYIFQLAYNEKEHILYDKCTYQWIKRYPDRGHVEVDLKINNHIEYNNGRGLIEGQDVITKHTVLDKYYDIFWTRGSYMTISENLKNAIEKENITGLAISPIDHMNFEFLDQYIQHV